jgi:hypothetical protein
MNVRQTQRTVTPGKRVVRERAEADASWSFVDQMKITGDGLRTVKVR